MFPALSAGEPLTVNFCFGFEVTVPVESEQGADESVPGAGIETWKDISGTVISPFAGKPPSPETV
jgi:hypothetical protein